MTIVNRRKGFKITCDGCEKELARSTLEHVILRKAKELRTEGCHTVISGISRIEAFCLECSKDLDAARENKKQRFEASARLLWG